MRPLVLLAAIAATAAAGQDAGAHRHDAGQWSHTDVTGFLVASGMIEAPTATPHEHGGEGVAGEAVGGQGGHGAHEGASGAEAREHAGHTAAMVSSTSPDEPMDADGSGTAWLPPALGMEGAHYSAGDWGVMIHGAAFLRYTQQDVFDSGTRGDGAFSAPNWVMGMAQRRLGPNGVVTGKVMLSLDPLTEGGNGYPLLFQSGETFEGERLVDRQHPHDLFSELALGYAHRVAPGTSLFGYVGYPGEPVAGPVAFMHRPSARYNPDSPLGHHWHDATHVAFGVLTAGVASGPVKFDASLFNGREPNEERLGFDRPRFTSYGGRITYAPSDRVVLHLARSFLEEPEVLEPGVDQWRTTASAMYSVPLGGDGDVAASLVWGVNEKRPGEGVDHHAGVQHALLGEGTVRLGHNVAYGRAEFAQKSAEELAIEAEELHDEVFDITALTLGLAREVFAAAGFNATLGAQGTWFGVPSLLQSIYGDSPVSLQVYLRLTPRINH